MRKGRPWIMRLLLLSLALGYLVWPYDLFPDFFVGPGWIDDLILIGLFCWYLFIYKRKRSGYETNDRGNRESGDGEGEERSGKAGRSEHTFKESGPLRDPHSVLGIGKDASPETIKKAYRRLASQYHPDKVAHLGGEFKELAERRFKEIQEAYQELRAQSR